MIPKSVLITGCSLGGIGDALAQSFHEKGHLVFATARSLTKVEHLRGLGIQTLALDVADEDSLRDCVEKVSEKTNKHLDILVNNAGVAYSMPLLDSSLADSRKVFDVNFFGVLATIQAFSPLLIEARGRIVNISSVAQFAPVPYMGVYNCSKSAVAMLSDNLRLELAPFGIKVICVITGGILTHIFDNDTGGHLPPGSAYEADRDHIEQIMKTVAHKYMGPVNPFAKKVVNNALSWWPSQRLFAGDNAATMWALSTFTWHNIWDWIFPRIYEISAVKEKLKIAKHRSARED